MKNSIQTTSKILIKSFLIPLSIFIFNFNSLYGQWIQQNLPSGQGIVLSVDFFNAEKGITGGWYINPLDNNISGRAFYTIDGGAHWLLSEIPHSVRAITNIKYISDNNAFAVGANNISNADDKISDPKSLLRSGSNYRSAMGITCNLNYSAVLLKSTNGGVSWFTFGNLPDGYNYLYQLEIINQEDILTIGTQQSGINFSGKLGASTDGGNSWSNVNIPVSSGDLNGLQYIDGKIFAAGYEETSSSDVRGVLLKSDDNGITWTKRIYTEDDGFNDIKFTNNLTGYACSYVTSNSQILNSRVYRTTDGGNSWNSLNIDLESVAIYKIGVHRNTGVITIFGNRFGDHGEAGYDECVILNSIDYGENWTSQGSDIDRNVILREIIYLNSNNAYIAGCLPNAGSPAGGMDPHIYHTKNGGSQFQPISIPNDFKLFQNYPNPFNPATQIKFSLIQDEFISLKIYDSSGKEIRTLFEGNRIAGSHVVIFDAVDVPSGIYFYTLKAKKYTQTLKMALIK